MLLHPLTNFEIWVDKIWVDKGNKFFNKSMKSWLGKTAIEVYSTHNEEKSVTVEISLEP